MAVVKTNPSNIVKPFTRLAVAQNALSGALQTSYTLCGGQNYLNEPQQVLHRLCSGQDALSEPLQTYVLLRWKHTLRSFRRLLHVLLL